MGNYAHRHLFTVDTKQLNRNPKRSLMSIPKTTVARTTFPRQQEEETWRANQSLLWETPNIIQLANIPLMDTNPQETTTELSLEDRVDTWLFVSVPSHAKLYYFLLISLLIHPLKPYYVGRDHGGPSAFPRNTTNKAEIHLAWVQPIMPTEIYLQLSRSSFTDFYIWIQIPNEQSKSSSGKNNLAKTTRG